MSATSRQYREDELASDYAANLARVANDSKAVVFDECDRAFYNREAEADALVEEFGPWGFWG